VAHDDEEESQTTLTTVITPLNGPRSLTGTDIVPDIYLSHLQTSASNLETDYNLDSSSPFYVDVHEELKRLVLLFEIFMVFCMLLIIDISWESLVVVSFVYLVLTLLALSAVLPLALKRPKDPILSKIISVRIFLSYLFHEDVVPYLYYTSCM
jgi:hypothetical protein